MKRSRSGKRGRFALPLFLFILSVSLQAQVTVHSPLWEEKNCLPGEKYEVKAVIYNRADVPVEIFIVQKDYLFRDNKHNFFNIGKLERSNGSWITIPHSRMLLPAQRKVLLTFPIQVPEDVGVGTYHSIIGIMTKQGEVRKENVSMGLNVQHNIQVVSNVNSEKAERKLEIVGVEIKDDKLVLTIKNIGQHILTFNIVPPILNIQADKRMRLYPNMEQTVELNISELSDGEYKNLRFLLDDGKTFVQPAFISFIKGELPEKEELYYLEGERLAERGKRKPAFPLRLYAVLSYGGNFRSAGLNGSLNLFKNLSFSMSSNYREWEYVIVDKMVTHRGAVNLRMKNFSASYSMYFFEDYIYEMVGANYHYKNLYSNLNYSVNRKMLQGNIRYSFLKRWSINFFGYYDFETQKNRWAFSLLIPIL